MRLVLHFARFGPYHLARLRSVAEELAPLGWEVIGLQTASTDATYEWRESLPGPGSAGGEGDLVTLFPGRVYDEIPSWECRRRLAACLDELAPDAVAVPGWGSLDARLSLGWCRRHGAKAVIMSETREIDGARLWWKEQIKRLMMRHVHGALVGGAAHRDYLATLGIPLSRIELGYNVVDNAYFAAESAKWRDAGRLSAVASGKEAPFFLASNRFIERKNLMRLIEAYAEFCQRSTALTSPETGPPTAPWSLCLLGDGHLKARLIARCHELRLAVIESAPWESSLAEATEGRSADRPSIDTTGTVYFPGFRQIEELPRFYAAAGAFIHPALEEPWGLVLNEAMACGLPVLSGSHVGAAAELIREGSNGWTFDAGDTREMAEAMARLASLTEAERLEMGRASAEWLEERCPTEAFGRGLRSLLADR
jgi:1,2-diacylglycerol 3-alpha-glucosyltransferase